MAGGPEFLVCRKVSLPGHFGKPVHVVAVEPLGGAMLLRVRTDEGEPDETVVSKSFKAFCKSRLHLARALPWFLATVSGF